QNATGIVVVERNGTPHAARESRPALDLLADVCVKLSEAVAVVPMINRDVADDARRRGEPLVVVGVELVLDVGLEERKRPNIIDMKVGDVHARFYVVDNSKHDTWRVGYESPAIWRWYFREIVEFKVAMLGGHRVSG